MLQNESDLMKYQKNYSYLEKWGIWTALYLFKIHILNPNPQYQRMWLYLEIETFKRQLS